MSRQPLLVRLTAVPLTALAIAPPIVFAVSGEPWWLVAAAGGLGLAGLVSLTAVVRSHRTDLGGPALELRDQDYRRVIASLHEGVVVQAPDGTILANNAAAERILGLSANQLRGLSSRDPRWRAVDEEGNPLTPDQHPSSITLRTGEPCRNVVMGVHRGDGSRVWVLVNSQAVASTGADAGHSVVISFVDITAQRDAESGVRRLEAFSRGILDSANVCVISTDLAGTIQHWNATATRLLGWTAWEMIGKRTPAAIHDPAEIAARAAELSAAFGQPVAPGFETLIARTRADDAPDEREWTYIAKDGRRFPVQLSVTTLHDQHGRPIGYLGIASDITGQRRDREELVRAKAAAESARAEAEAGARVKSDFLATMSHEIRTPMNGIIGMADLLADTGLDSRQRNYVDTVRGCADSLLVLINDVLDFSKIESGSLELERIPIDPRRVAEEAVAVLAERAQAKGLELVCRIDGLIPDAIDGDQARLRQVLVNLLSNAVKFTDAGEVVLSLSCAVDGLEFAVSDTGIGIPAEALPRLFQAFAQADASTTRRFGGTGLGLAISKRLAGLMGGRIEIASVYGRGSTFSLHVPVEGGVSGIAPERGLRGRRVLCVEAHPLARGVVHEILASAGAEVEQAAAGAEALRLVEERHAAGAPFDLLIADLRLPGLDGIALAAELRRSRHGLPVLLTTLLAEGIPERSFGELGLAGCISKPVRREQLLDAALRALAGESGSRSQPIMAAAALAVRVLVAEDNLVNQRVVVALLERLGIHCDTVPGGREALRALASTRFDLVLMDCQMPGMDGYSATTAWRTGEPAGRRLPIVALTANALPGDRERCLAAGMDDYLSKPVRLDALVEVLQRWLPDLPLAKIIPANSGTASLASANGRARPGG